ncbi:MAG: glutathione peroxidase [Rhizobiales bacterium]|nr:glutathione peroxidase [Hyphomicrobiales bacterium]
MATKEKSAYDFSFKSLTGKPLPLKQFKGQPLLIVNTASKCGFTPQYAGLEKIWHQHKADGLIVLGVPSNDFANQEPGSADEIAEFCEINFGVDFPLTDKVHVKGREAHPLFQWMGDQGGFLSRPRWNFYKYLIGRDGQLKTWFSSIATPDSTPFKKAVKELVKP